VFISTPLVNSGQVYIINAKNDTVSQNHPAIGAGAGGINASLMAVTPDKTKVAVFAAILNTISVINTQTETGVSTIGLAGATESMATMPDNSTLIAAEPTAPFSGSVQNGLVQFVDLTNGVVTASLSVPQARRLVLSHNGTKALVFSDDYSVHLIDTAAKTATAVTSTSFDRAVNAVFSTDDGTAYILSCGAQCGGTAANVSALNTSSGAVGAPTAVTGATVGIIDSSNRLYVAGSPTTGGFLDILDPTSLTVTKSAIPIGDGYHTLMALTALGQLFIGAQNCTNGLCMTILNTSSQAVYINPCDTAITRMCPSGNVTGMQPIDSRGIMYVVQGGILHIYDLKKDPPTENLTVGIPFLSLLGNLVDVKLVD
jgi:DNA-binding beta-propeller fold protein YncE